MSAASASPGWYENPQGVGLRWWDGSQWTEHVHAGQSDAAAIDPRRANESPARILLGGLGAFTGAVAFFVGGIALIAVVVTLVVHPGAESSTPAGGGESATGLMEGSSQAECEVQLEALDQTAEVLEDRGQVPPGERAPSEVAEERWGSC